MKQLRDTITKAEIASMPKVLFEGRIFVVYTEADADKAVQYLKTQQVVGVDTETRPSFRKGMTHKVALLQIATSDTCFLFRLNRIGMPGSLQEFLMSDTLKVGLSLKDDFMMLRRRKDVHTEEGNWIELQDYVKRFGIQDQSLQKIYANLFGRKISKSQRLSNWEAETLKECQMKYAATDARLERHQEARQNLVRDNHRAVLARHFLQGRFGLVHRRHEPIVQVAQVGRLVAHRGRIDFLELVDVVPEHHVHRPAGILAAFANHLQDTVHEARILQYHQVRREYEAIVHARARLGNFLDLRNFLGGAGHRPAEQLFFRLHARLGNVLLDDGNLAARHLERTAHDEAGRCGNTHKDLTCRPCPERLLRAGINRVLR